jgi:hypothetical protein
MCIRRTWILAFGWMSHDLSKALPLHREKLGTLPVVCTHCSHGKDALGYHPGAMRIVEGDSDVWGRTCDRSLPQDCQPCKLRLLRLEGCRNWLEIGGIIILEDGVILTVTCPVPREHGLEVLGSAAAPQAL